MTPVSVVESFASSQKTPLPGGEDRPTAATLLAVRDPDRVSPGLREVIPQRSHHDVVNPYRVADSDGCANRPRPGPAVHVGIGHSVLHRALFALPEPVPEAGLNLPHVAICLRSFLSL